MERKVSTARSDLEGMLADEAAEPKALPLSLLEDITGGFSPDNEIGSGGFAVVYKGILGDRAVGVKRLSKAHMHEKEFHREVLCLMQAKHKNVVRFLGYRADTQGNMEMYDGKLVMADVQQRLLCFEYMPKGSLDKYITALHANKYITDASYEWGTCYKIIKGICVGLLYLHENHIVHLDLKSANILLDDNMVPKIADFGLSRCFDKNQSQDITKTIAGTMGYLAPEFREGGVITCSTDLYSLGVIIVEILTGQRGYQAIGDVLERWSDGLERPQGNTQCEQIGVCYEIGLKCIDFIPDKRPASARNIIDRLLEIGSPETAETAASTSGAIVTESKRESNNGQPSVFGSMPDLTAEAAASILGATTTMATESKGKSNNSQPSVLGSAPTQTEEASASTSGVVASVTTTKSKGESHNDQPRVFCSVPAPGRGVGGVEDSDELRQETLHATVSISDMVEPMFYLYVSVVKARDHNMDMTGTLDPYVKVKVGNFIGMTKYLEENPNPVQRQVFAFCRDHLQSNQLEVIVMEKYVLKGNFVGRVLFDLSDIPMPSSPLAPQWYRLADRSDEKLRDGEIMLAVWWGTQADEAFQEAYHSYVHSLSQDGLSNMRSKVYYSPKLMYLKVVVISAQDLVPTGGGSTIAKIQLGGQIHRTRPGQPQGSANPTWNEEFMFVLCEAFEDPLVVTVEEHGEPMGRVIIPVAAPYLPRNDLAKWFSMSCELTADEATVDVTDNNEESRTFAGKIYLQVSLETAYHVLDEPTHCSSDLQPSEKKLRKSAVGTLEVGILGARNLVAMKGEQGRLSDPYCVAKYGEKWVRTRTLLNTVAPHWNEEHSTWEVFDISTAITIAVFDNCHLYDDDDGDAKDQWIGKVHIRLAALETNRVCTHYYPLMALTQWGLKKTGELHLAIRFTCTRTAWAKMLAMYGKPLLPKMHYTNPISVQQVDCLLFQAMQMVVTQLERVEPPLRREVVEYMLDVDSHMFSLRRAKANFYRVTSLFSVAGAVAKWFDSICKWKNPQMTILVHVLFLILMCYPELILPMVFLCLFMIGAGNYRRRHMDTVMSHAERAEADESDTFPTSSPDNVVRMRYDRLRGVAGRLQKMMGELATQAERVQSLVSWRDPRATAIFVTLSLVVSVVLFVTPFQVVVAVVGLYLLRHPCFRSKLPFTLYKRKPLNRDSRLPALNFFDRLPSNDDMILNRFTISSSWEELQLIIEHIDLNEEVTLLL